MSTLRSFLGTTETKLINNINFDSTKMIRTSDKTSINSSLTKIDTLNKFGVNGIKDSPWTEKTPNIDSARHSAITYNNGTDQIMIVYGGHDSLVNLNNNTWEYNITQDTWTQKTSGATARRQHSAVTYNNGTDQIMIVYGGWNGTTYLNDTWEYNITQNIWTQKLNGLVGMGAHSAVTYNNGTDQIMIVFAGNKNGTNDNTVWEYNITKNTWLQKTSGSTAKYGHSAVTYNNGIDQMMIVYGGVTLSTINTNFNDIWQYNITQDTWTQKTSGAIGRRQHSAVTYNNGTDQIMIVYGGWDGINDFNDIWEYNITKELWTQKTSGNKIQKLHTAVTYHDGTDHIMIVYGGHQEKISNFVYNHTLEYNITTDNYIHSNTIVSALQI